MLPNRSHPISNGKRFWPRPASPGRRWRDEQLRSLHASKSILVARIKQHCIHVCFSLIFYQTQADLISIPVDRPLMRETTALGAAIAAGFAVGVWKDFSDLESINSEGGTVFEPQLEKDKSKKAFERWEKAVYSAAGFS